MEIYIDFDGTISPAHYPDKPTVPPFPNCVDTIKQFKQMGHTIIIYSCRANPDLFSKGKSFEATQEMVDYLNKWSIPYDRIDSGKPLYSILICDRAISAKDGNWNRIFKEYRQIIPAELPK